VARHAADRPSAHGGTGDSVIWTVVDFAGAWKKRPAVRSFHGGGMSTKPPELLAGDPRSDLLSRIYQLVYNLDCGPEY
jgi:hypothetical protein